MTMKNYDFLKFMSKNGFSQVSLSTACENISEPMLSRIINGRKVPTSEQISELAKALKTSDLTIQKMFKDKMEKSNANSY